MSNQSKVSQSINDAYFTPSKSAQFCVDILREHKWVTNNSRTLEPCCGAGSLAVWLPGTVEVRDLIDYGYPNTIISNYLESQQSHFDLVFTNPPFGRAGSIASKIFNRAALDSDRIAMILPTSFRKISIVDRLNQWFHPVVDELLPCQLFELPDGSTRKVNTVFQMWERRNYKRGYIHAVTNCLDFFRQVPQDVAEYAFRGQGASAGRVLQGLNYSPASTRFLSGGKEKVEQFDWTTIASFTAGIPAIGLRDVSYGLMLHETYQPIQTYLTKGLVSHLINIDKVT